jgi:hypothetical protein
VVIGTNHIGKCETIWNKIEAMTDSGFKMLWSKFMLNLRCIKIAKHSKNDLI